MTEVEEAVKAKSMLKSLRSIIKNQLHRYDRAVIFRPASLSHRNDAILQPTLRMLLAELLLTHQQITLIQIGAFDGISDDPVSSFLADTPNVRAIVLEPQPDAFTNLVEHYADNPNVEALNVAVGETVGVSTLYVVEGQDAGDPPWCQQIASTSREHILRHARWIPALKDRIGEINVVTLSPSTLLKTRQLQQVHALIVDAEGDDWKIVSTFLAANAIPSVMQFEWKHLTRSQLSDAVEQLADLRYALEFVGPDVIATRIK